MFDFHGYIAASDVFDRMWLVLDRFVQLSHMQAGNMNAVDHDQCRVGQMFRLLANELLQEPLGREQLHATGIVFIGISALSYETDFAFAA